jgi:prevent-host-death family protein
VRRIGIRELRNDTSRVVRRAMRGERIVVTIDGVPAAQLGPLNDGTTSASIDDLVSAGRLRAPRAASSPRPAAPLAAPSGRPTTEILREHRDR